MAYKERTRILDLLDRGKDLIGQQVTVMGWVRNRRGSKNVAFISLNDGSKLSGVQVVVEAGTLDEASLKKITVGAAISVDGEVVPSQGTEQDIEVKASDIKILGVADPEKYPIQPKRHSFDFLREHAHLRFRTQTFSAVFRIRHAMTYAIHKFFHDKGFYNLHTPIITASDAEGAGEMFSITAFDLNKLPKDEDGRVDHSQDLFGRHTHLTVSGQLEAELGAMGLGEVYTFGPTFRAENSNTSRHAAEFWMIEPEMAFADLEDDMNLAEEMLQYLVSYLLEHCREDIEFLHQRELDEDKGKKKEERRAHPLLERLKMVRDNAFERITYTEAIELLRRSKPYKKGKFVFPVEWGVDLQSEHERYLVEKKFERPVIITDYPRDIKAFYMKVNDDGRTVGAMDVLVPGIGEIIGGSQREERYEVLLENMRKLNVPEESLWWYLDIRKFGTAPHSGFGLGFERWIMFVTGMTNIRDVIPFPRTPDNAEF